MRLSSFARSGFARFGLFGVMATLIHVTVFTVLVEKFDVAAVTASVPAFVCAMLASYAANNKWTFRGRRGHAAHLPRYFAVSLFGLGLNALITYVVVNAMGLWYGVALMMVVTTVPVITYLLNRHWTYGAEGGPDALSAADAVHGRERSG